MIDSNPYGGPQPGAPVNHNPYDRPLQPTPPATPARFSGLGLAGLLLGAFAWLVAWIPFGFGLFLSFVPVVLAITFGIIDVTTANKKGRSMVLGLIGLVLGGVIFLGYFTGLGTLW